MSSPKNQSYAFGIFRLDPAERLLWREDELVPLQPKVFDTLVMLVENHGRLVDKDELMAGLWPDTVVEEATLARNVSNLRKALGEAATEQKYLETVPKHGYRFIADVTELNGAKGNHAGNGGPRAITVTEALEEQKRGSEETGSRPSVQQERRPSRPRQDLRKGSKATRTIVFAASVLTVLGIAALYRWRTGAQVTAVRNLKSIAILPFAPIARGQSGDEYLQLGIADSLITNLSSIGQIVVRPTSSVRRYSGLETDPIAAGKALGVDCVLEGSVQRLGPRVRVTARLLRVADGRGLWSGEFDEKSSDIFTVQDRISEQIAEALALKLTGEERRLLAKRYTENSDAYELYQKGRFFWNKRTPESLNKGIEFFTEAIARDPNYALAYAGLADSYALLDLYTVQRGSEIFIKARAAAEKALQLDDALAEAHASLAYVKYYYDWDWSGAEAEFKRAIASDPGYATAHQWYAEYLFYMGRFEESIAEINRAHELDPFSLAINTELGSPYYYARQYDTALDKYRAAHDMDPNFWLANYCLALCYGQKGRFNEAIESLGDGVSGAHGYLCAMSGRTKEAKDILGKLMEASKQGRSPLQVASVLTALGDKDRAFEWLAKAVEERDERIVMLKVDPHFDPLRSDSRFNDLLLRIGLARGADG